MRHSAIIAAVLCALATLTFGQNRVFDWTPANSETIPLEPASLHAGRIYYPKPLRILASSASRSM
jgi:hypothetical protein